MQAVLIAAGLVVLSVAFLEAVVTTMTAGNGAGPLTGRLGHLLRRTMLSLSGHRPFRLLSYGGALILLVSVAVWVLLLWAGWTLIFLGAGDAIVVANTGTPATVPATIYFAGFVVFTLGVGDVVAATGTWQVVTALASGLGLFLVTLSITYLVSVVGAAVTRRQFAQSVNILGTTGAEIVLTHWTDGQLSSQLSSRVQSLTAQLLETTQQHLAYPVLHFFHATTSGASAPRAVAALDDALVLLGDGLDPSVAPQHDVLEPLRRAVEHYTEIVHSSGSGSPGEPALPELQPLIAAGVPTVGAEQYRDAGSRHAERRAAVHRIVTSDAWAWPGQDRRL